MDLLNSALLVGFGFFSGLSVKSAYLYARRPLPYELPPEPVKPPITLKPVTIRTTPVPPPLRDLSGIFQVDIDVAGNVAGVERVA